MRSDVSELSQLVNLPAEPTEAKWQSREIGAGTDWELVALMTFDARGFDEISRSSQQTPSLDGSLGFSPFEWLQIEDIPGLTRKSGPLTVVSAGSHSAEAFLSSPLNSGFIVVVPKNKRILLYLSTN